VAFVLSTCQVAAATRDCAAIAGSTADLAWERCQEQAAIAFRAGDPMLSSRLWAEAFAIARKRFGRGDPRLATSLTNQALVLRRRRQDYQAKTMFQEALDVWSDSWRWIHLMTRSPAALGQRHSDHLDAYGPQARAWFNALAQRGREATVALERYDHRFEIGLDAWFAIRPKRAGDLRKLLGAVLLIAPKPRP
jgi:Tetratricopeptide repeat